MPWLGARLVNQRFQSFGIFRRPILAQDTAKIVNKKMKEF